jgi:L-seryl-tRNA(Ser) seleniumtransferase
LLLASDPDRAARRIPLWAMIGAPVAALSELATSLATALRDELGLNAAAVAAESYLGGGAAPFQPIPTAAVVVSPPFPTHLGSEAALALALRRGDPPVVTRVQKGLVIFDLRTITEDRLPVLLDAIRKVCHDRNSQAGSVGLPYG